MFTALLLVSASLANDPPDTNERVCVDNPASNHVPCDVVISEGPDWRDNFSVCNDPFPIPPCDGEESDWIIATLPVFPGESVHGVRYTLFNDDFFAIECSAELDHTAVLFVEHASATAPFTTLHTWSVPGAAAGLGSEVVFEHKLPLFGYTVVPGDVVRVAIQYAGDIEQPGECFVDELVTAPGQKVMCVQSCDTPTSSGDWAHHPASPPFSGAIPLADFGLTQDALVGVWVAPPP